MKPRSWPLAHQSRLTPIVAALVLVTLDWLLSLGGTAIVDVVVPDGFEGAVEIRMVEGSLRWPWRLRSTAVADPSGLAYVQAPGKTGDVDIRTVRSKIGDIVPIDSLLDAREPYVWSSIGVSTGWTTWLFVGSDHSRKCWREVTRYSPSRSRSWRHALIQDPGVTE